MTHLHRFRPLLIVILLIFTSLMLSSNTVTAASAANASTTRLPAFNIQVTTTNDTVDINPGDGACADAANLCSLRAAIMEANALEPGSTILVPYGNYIMMLQGEPEDASAAGDLDITNSMSIIGNQGTTTDFGFTYLDFYYMYPLNDGGIHIKGEQPINVNLVDLVIGYGTRDPGVVDGITYGGNVWAEGANVTATLTRTYIGIGYALRGGGIAITDGAKVTVDSSTLVQNTGGISSGGIEVNGTGSALTLVNSTFFQNISYNGGGISVRGGGSATLNNVTMVNNGYAMYTGVGGIENVDGTVNLSNSLLAFNQGTTGADCGGVMTSTGDNLVTSSLGCTLSTDDLLTEDPGLDQFNIYPPGRIPTFALLENSPAIDAGTLETCEEKDQRGVDRPVGAGCDIGAFEYNAVNLVTNGSFETPDAANEKRAADWKSTGSSRRVCNQAGEPPIAFDGECALILRGKADQKSSVSQKLTDQLPATGSIVTTRFYLQGQQINGNVSFGAIIKYTDNTPSTKLVFQVPPGDGFGYLLLSAPVIAEVESIKLRGGYNGPTGRLMIDLVSLSYLSDGSDSEARAIALGSDSTNLFARSPRSAKQVQMMQESQILQQGRMSTRATGYVVRNPSADRASTLPSTLTLPDLLPETLALPGENGRTQ